MPLTLLIVKIFASSNKAENGKLILESVGGNGI